MKVALCALSLALLLPGAAGAWGWLQGPPPVEEQTEVPPVMSGAAPSSVAGACIAAILAAEGRYQIPGHLLLALGVQEAGWKSPQGLTVWPWSVNAAGEGRRFASRGEAEAFVQRKQAEGVSSIDVGCLQINLRWHPEAFATLSQGFDPTQNVDYAARFLRGLFEESGDWQVAAGRYHSRSGGPQATYLAGLARNQQVVNAQIDAFYALAGGHSLPETAFAELAPPPNYRTEGAIWGAQIAGSEGARRTLYSADDLQPVLPDFLPPEA